MILLDTCVLLWLVADQSGLSKEAKRIIQKNANNLYVSSISAFEVALKNRKGKIALPMSPEKCFMRALKHHGIAEIPITSSIAIASILLPNLHNDPCDRMIIATAKEYNMNILTPDSLIMQYTVNKVLW